MVTMILALLRGHEHDARPERNCPRSMQGRFRRLRYEDQRSNSHSDTCHTSLVKLSGEAAPTLRNGESRGICPGRRYDSPPLEQFQNLLHIDLQLGRSNISVNFEHELEI